MRVDRKTVCAELGISKQRLSVLIKQGRIPEHEDGIDLEEARAYRTANSDPQNVASHQVRQGKQPKGPPTASAGGGQVTYMQARTQQAAFKAKAEELKYKQQVGRLVDRDEVKASAFTMARKLRDRLLAFPHRLAPQLPPEMRKMLFDEFDALVRELQEDVAGLA